MNLNHQKLIYHKVIDVADPNAPWLIMVHGFTHNCSYFSAQVPDFQKDFRILLTDLRGHGKSTHVMGPYGVEEYTDDILETLDEVGVENAHYWGTHTGSAVGLVLVLRHPERFTSLILEGTFLPAFPMPRVGELINRAKSIAKSKGVNVALEDWFNHADWFAYIRDHPQVCRAKKHRAMLSEFSGIPWLSELTPREVTSVSEMIGNINLPTLIYNGKYDLDDFKQAALYLEAGLPNAQREEIQNAGGFPGWENPQDVNLLVRSFITKKAS